MVTPNYISLGSVSKPNKYLFSTKLYIYIYIIIFEFFEFSMLARYHRKKIKMWWPILYTYEWELYAILGLPWLLP
jgi:hypothetical protein